MKSAQELYGNTSHDEQPEKCSTAFNLKVDLILLQRGCQVHPGQSVETKRRRRSPKFLGCARRWEGGLCCIEHCDRSTSLWNGLLSNARRDPEHSSGEKDDSRWRAIIPYFCLLLFCPKSWKRPILFGVLFSPPLLPPAVLWHPEAVIYSGPGSESEQQRFLCSEAIQCCTFSQTKSCCALRLGAAGKVKIW